MVDIHNKYERRRHGRNEANGIIRELIEEMDKQNINRRRIAIKAGYQENMIWRWSYGKLPKGYQAVVDVAELMGMELKLVPKK